MILITRPLNEARLLAKELKTFSMPIIIEPLTSFKYYKKKTIFHEKKIFIVSSLQSARALRIYKKNYRSIISKGKFLVVGMKVATELKSLGVKKIIKQFNTSEHLLKYLSQSKFFQYEIEYLCGSIVNQHFINGLKNCGIDYKKIVVYKTIPKQQLSQKCLSVLKGKKVKLVLIYSAYTAKLFSNLLRCNNLNNALSNTYVACLSERIANTFDSRISFAGICWSKSANQDSLLLKVQSMLKLLNKSSSRKACFLAKL